MCPLPCPALPCPGLPPPPIISSNGFFDKGRVYVWWWFLSSQIYYPRVKGCLTKAHTNTHHPTSTHVYLTALNYIVFFFSSTFQPFQECLQAINSNHLMPQLHCCQRTLFVSFPWSSFEWRRFDGSLDSIWNIVWKDNREHLHLFFFFFFFLFLILFRIILIDNYVYVKTTIIIMVIIITTATI